MTRGPKGRPPRRVPTRVAPTIRPRGGSIVGERVAPNTRDPTTFLNREEAVVKELMQDKHGEESE